MGKYNLGNSESSVNEKITKENLFIDEKKANKLMTSIDKNLEALEKSMLKTEDLLNKVLLTGEITGSRQKVFKSWSRKCQSQANSVAKLRIKANDSYAADLKYYPIKLLNDRINELEGKLEELEKEMR